MIEIVVKIIVPEGGFCKDCKHYTGEEFAHKKYCCIFNQPVYVVRDHYYIGLKKCNGCLEAL